MTSPGFRGFFVGVLVVAAIMLVNASAAAQQPGKDPPPPKKSLSAKEHFSAAKRAVDEDRLTDARRHVELCLRDLPNSTAVHLLAARINRLLYDYKKVEKHLDECKRIEGKLTERIQLEWMLLRADDGELDALEKGLISSLEKKDPDSILILETLSRVYLQELRFHAAHRCLDEWLKKEPDNIRALDWRGWTREKLEFNEGSYEDYDRALKLVPGHWEIRLRLTQLLLAGLKMDEAAPHVEILRKTHPHDPEVRLALAQFLVFQGKTKEAQKLLDVLLNDNPKNAAALLYRGKLADEPSEKVQWFRKSLKVDPASVETHYFLYASLLKADRKEEAAAQFEKFRTAQADAKRLKQQLKQLEETPRNPDLLASSGEIFLRAKNETMGLPFLFRALRADPEHQKTHEILAGYYESQNEPEKAARHRKMAAKKAKESPPK